MNKQEIEKAIEAIKLLYDYNVYGIKDHHVDTAIFALQQQLNNGWILCTENLPKLEQNALLSLRSLDICTGFKANTEGMFYCGNEGYVEIENVLAWQPLPEPYEEVSND